MCGISGYLDLSRQMGGAELQTTITRMCDTLCHRGPDDQGIWIDETAGVALGHRRLSIVDLSPEGHQPMQSACGRYVLIYNGEIYNFQDLRRELEGFGLLFNGRSDTEVLLGAIHQWGLTAAIKHCIGMFAFALWDRKKRLLHLVRDRLGIKPLYYGWVGKAFVFGSELKAVRAYSGFKREIDRNALALYLRYNYIPAPYTIYRGIYKLLPGTLLTLNSAESRTDAAPVSYWSVKEVAERGVAEPFAGSINDAIVHLDALLRDAVKLRMIADVPLGAFLSGGVDSSTIVSLMQAQSEQPVKTFTIGFYEDGYNEAEEAKAVARHLGTEHTELYVTPEEAIAVIPRLPTLYDEPFSDSSQIPTFLVSELARRHVTVCLSGDGGDELFGGYPRYALGHKLWKKIGWVPPLGRKILSTTLSAFPTRMPPISSKYGRIVSLSDKLHKLSEILADYEPETLYMKLLSHWENPAGLVPGAHEPKTALTNRAQWATLPDFEHRMMYLDTVAYLPDNILVKVDRASMGVGLEARVPLLDHRVVEFAWRIPLSMKMRKGQSKCLLRQVLYKYVPQELIERPKLGFGVPIDAWLRGPLRGWGEELLHENRLRDEGYFAPEPIRKKWMEHLSGKRNWHYYLWDVLMFQAWLNGNA